MKNEGVFQSTVGEIAKLKGVTAIGKSGGAALPVAGESDIDLFVFCDFIPSYDARCALYNRLLRGAGSSRVSDRAGRFWGTCDFLEYNAFELCIMYFDKTELWAEIEAIRNGERLTREDEYFYPTGRCASILSMHIYEDADGMIGQ